MEQGLARKTVGAAVEAGDRREEILAAATALFAEHGYSDAVTQLLAERLGVGKGTIYRQFPSKRELFFAAADRAMVKLHEWIDERTRGAADPIERIKLGVRAYLEFFAEHPEFVELLIQERAVFKDRETPTYFEHRRRVVERWREHYRKAMAQGLIRETSAERISDVLSAVLYGSMFLNHLGGRSGAFSLSGDDILDIVLHGILGDRAPAPPAAVPPPAAD